jgi:peptidoglycan/xylan/chitin deacetylase (PgdA/CDA1 family)
VGNFITARQLINAVVHGDDLPNDAVMISFDDGYLDHYTNVLPILHDMKIEGMFFPPGQPITDGCVMDTNKIHFILASVPETAKIVGEIKSWVEKFKDVYGLPNMEQLWAQFARPSTYDSAEICFIKLVLQRGLPKAARNALVNVLFQKYVTSDESAFSAELYLSTDQIRMMYQSGQHIGSHGYSHEWFDLLGPDGQETEVRESLRFLNGIGVPTNEWIMCYPYGCYPYNAVDDQLRSTLTKYDCALALTDHGGKANLSEDDRFMLRRIDTNEIPAS